MKPPLSTFIAYKYLLSKKKEKNVSFMIKICFLGILIGTFALMLTLIITNGFEKTISEKMQGITSSIIINAPGQKLEDKSVKQVLKDEFGATVKAASSHSIKQVIIDQNKQQTVLFLKGVEPETEGLVSSIGTKITLPAYKKNPLKKLLKENQIIIGYKTAMLYNLSIGNTITLLVPEAGGKRKIYLNKKKAVVAGIFNVGLDEYDSKVAYCSLDFLKSIFKEKQGVDAISVSIEENVSEQEVVKKLRKRLSGLAVRSWKDLYPALVSSLKLEKYVMFFIIALISLVACMNMISLLFMQIHNKRRDIAIFKAMGMSHKQIKRIFLIIGLSITFFASTIGLSLAAGAGYLLEKYPFIKLPDVYFVSHLPARLDLENFIIVFLATILLGFLATWIPAKRTKNINIVDVLRQE